MKILQILIDDRTGGAEALAALLDREMSSRHHEMATLHIDPNGEAGRVERLRNVTCQLSGFCPDVVMSHCAIPNMYGRLGVVLTRRRPGTVIVLHSASRDYDDWKLRAAEQILSYLRRSVVVAVSDKLAAEYLDLGISTDVRVITNVADSRFVRRPAHALHGNQALRLLAVGRIDPQKDYLTIIEGVRYAVDRVLSRKICLRILGTVTDVAYLREVTSAIRSVKEVSVELLGPVANVLPHLMWADLFIHGAKSEASPSPVAVEEARSVGVPIVLADRVAREHRPGQILYNGGRARSLALALRQAVQTYAELEAAARSAAVDPAEARGRLDEWIDAYEAVCERSTAVSMRL